MPLLKRLTSIIIFTILGYQLGSIFTLRNITPTVIAAENPLIINQNNINVLLNRAASTLINCAAFRNEFPQKIPAILHFGKIHFAYVSTKNEPLVRSALAVTIAATKTMILTEHFFTLNEDEQEAVLGHELLHIIGIPSTVFHNAFFVDIKNDSVYRLTYACFPNAP